MKSISSNLKGLSFHAILLLFFTFIFNFQVYSLDTNSTKYFPLKPGNKWVYSWYSTQFGQSGKFSVLINQTLNTNGHLYYKYRESYYRVDSINGNIMLYQLNNGCPWSLNERMTDSLSALLFDTVRYNCGANYKVLADTNLRLLFGSQRRTKNFRLGNNGILYAKDFGVMELYTQSGNIFYVEHLQGCIIDGVLYGDTSLTTGLIKVASEVPVEFKLYQNYPNPFNSISKIRYSVPSGKYQILNLGYVTLKVYDILGRETITLVKEKQNPGTYEVEFDGTNYPSGIYFYKVITDNYNETKKMILIK